MVKQSFLPLLVAAFFVMAGPAAAQTFPDGPGKEILEKKCSACHAPEQVTTFGRSAEEWHEVVVNMIDLGAEVNEEETKVLVEYLAKNWPLKGAKPAEKPAEPAPAEKPAEPAPAEKPAEPAPAEKPAPRQRPALWRLCPRMAAGDHQRNSIIRGRRPCNWPSETEVRTIHPAAAFASRHCLISAILSCLEFSR